MGHEYGKLSILKILSGDAEHHSTTATHSEGVFAADPNLAEVPKLPTKKEENI